MKDATGRWLSLIGGRIHGASTIVEWQMNRQDLPAYSLSTAMRAYLFQHQVDRGARRIYFVAGTSHPIHNAMIPETIVDILASRPGLPRKILDRVAKVDAAHARYEEQFSSGKSLGWDVS